MNDSTLAAPDLPEPTCRIQSWSSSSSDNDFSDDESESSIIPLRQRPLPEYLMHTCPICMEPRMLNPSPCCSFVCCRPCWHLHISAAVNDGHVKLSCASIDCKKYLSKEFILDHIRSDTPLHERFMKLYINANQNPRSKTCESLSGDSTSTCSSRRSRSSLLASVLFGRRRRGSAQDQQT